MRWMAILALLWSGMASAQYLPLKVNNVGGGSYTFYSTDTGTNHLYYNSSEIGCTRTGTVSSTVVLCDDFGDGAWYECNCDQRSSELAVDGWCGTIFSGSGPTCSQGPNILNAINSDFDAGITGADYSASTGAFDCSTASSGCDENMADHNLGPSNNSYNELYLRAYIKFAPSFVLQGNTKLLTFNTTPAGTGGVFVGSLGTGSGDALTICPVRDCSELGYVNPLDTSGAGDPFLHHNVSSFNFETSAGNWVFVEFHVKLETTAGTSQDGVWELWADNCGSDITTCPSSPTLRASYNNVRWRSTTNTDLIESIWLESNTGGAGVAKSTGDYLLWKFLRVETSGPIGVLELPN